MLKKLKKNLTIFQKLHKYRDTQKQKLLHSTNKKIKQINSNIITNINKNNINI